ncbi:MAG: endopeptidase La [Acidimicrobiales bacterium]|nr:endopeptidase La [Hyphomonadaceae bacterium]RZV42507.1 MAG: endopeptidase La [Acidimicrobiales bacterium]
MTELQKLPVLPLRDIVVFPHMVVPLFVGREKSINALEEVMKKEKKILLLTQKDAATEDPSTDELNQSGCIATILQLLKLPDGTVRVLVEGQGRAAVDVFTSNKDFYEATVLPMENEDNDSSKAKSLSRSVSEQFEKYVKLNKKIAEDIVTAVAEISDPAKLADTISVHLGVKIPEKQELLAETNVAARLEKIFELLDGEISVMKVEKKIRGRVKRQMEKTQREYYLNEQMKAIQSELGGGKDGNDEISELNEKIEATKFTKEAKEKAQAELKKLSQMSPMSAEANVSRNYIDWLLSVPWNKKKRVRKDLGAAQKILDDDHYGLEKVKERIVEHLAVQTRTKKLKGPILCLVGPPGVGKTSLGRSIANATGREFVRVSLGGVRDESEIRGHRRTYIGSMPGRIIQSMKKVKTSNPMFLLDEIDKMGSDMRGDPSAALLEVLDPEQNANFNDHYLEVDYDLSDVMFVTTANSLDMSQPLMDRMEIIRIPGYTEDEKIEIAERHLIPKQIEGHGLKKGEINIKTEAVRDIIRYYTREAGVRSLERDLARLARKAVTKIVAGDAKRVTITSKNIEDFLGVKKFRFGETDKEDQIGIVTGLAWTQTGGDILTIEAVAMSGKGKMTITGNLKDVMKESISAANSYVQARAPEFGISPRKFRNTDIHVHVPEGATPKDGPSAGVGMITSMVSVLTGITVRKDIAMTGEITLRGRVLPIGGLKEKLLAAIRGGVKTVLIPLDNAKDLAEIPDNVKSALEIIPVGSVDEVLRHALTKPLTPIEWTAKDEAELSGIHSRDSSKDQGGIVAH